ncbi:hypothetical protein EJG51_017945 [Undibacterium piscinae]|uniref:Uncharacterized protein n=1 Tax=Undibacterium piscinae TaxID=2495591 RepID=A0A6M4AAR0_9BURK|nr:hypothetical protein EJG51_017945 [Undibacterium piscinae]
MAGAGHVWKPAPAYLLIALLLATGALSFLFYLLMSSWSQSDSADSGTTIPPADASVTVGASSVLSAATSVIAPQLPAHNPEREPERDADPTRDLSSYVARGEKPTMPEVIQRLHQAGVHTGLGAFSPPGTRPPMVGLAVPEDFALPKGYVRHHQATDDGQRIEAILMFAPDFQLFDTAGKPVALPKDRVVPPELAPPGLPNRRIVIPAPIDAAKP